MSHIFISHSKKDENVLNLFLRSFAGTNVKPYIEEFEKEIPTGINAEKIERDILMSEAVFVLLSENVDNLRHTRDWVTWECGTVKNKEIWVFEPSKSLGKISVAVPRLTHYVVYKETDEFRKFLRSIIDLYDGSNVLAILGGAGLAGAALNKKDRTAGVLLGGLAGLIGLVLHSSYKRSTVIDRYAYPAKCNHCLQQYNVYQYGDFRCPVCNTKVSLPKHQYINCLNTKPKNIFSLLKA